MAPTLAHHFCAFCDQPGHRTLPAMLSCKRHARQALPAFIQAHHGLSRRRPTGAICRNLFYPLPDRAAHCAAPRHGRGGIERQRHHVSDRAPGRGGCPEMARHPGFLGQNSGPLLRLSRNFRTRARTAGITAGKPSGPDAEFGKRMAPVKAPVKGLGRLDQRLGQDAPTAGRAVPLCPAVMCRKSSM